jgi:hypothetical protein
MGVLGWEFYVFDTTIEGYFKKIIFLDSSLYAVSSTCLANNERYLFRRQYLFILRKDSTRIKGIYFVQFAALGQTRIKKDFPIQKNILFFVLPR